MKRTAISLILLCSILPLRTLAENSSGGDKPSCSLVKIKAERLPDLNIPRNAHAAFCVNGEVTVVGGHTISFIPTATAEYFKDGKWHLMNTEYTHDNATCVVLHSGKVLLAGGHAEPMGVGRTYSIEEYEPTTHTFRGFSCLDRKRTLATGMELDSGRVVIAGNWYEDDAIELFDGDRTCAHAKDVTINRASPYLLRTSDNDVLVLGNGGTHGEMLCSDVVDRLKGEPLHVSLLRQWQPLFYEAPFQSGLGFIGDESHGDYSWLLPVQDWSVGDSTDWAVTRPMAFMHVRDTVFSLLPTTCPVPVVCQYGTVFYYSPCITDRQRHRAYVHGIDKDNRHYLLCVEYDKKPSPLTLYYTDPMPEVGFPEIVLTDDGNLMIIGGITYNKGIDGQLDHDNFSPLGTVYLLHVSTPSVTASDSSGNAWLWGLLAVAALLCLGMLMWRKRRTPSQLQPNDEKREKTSEQPVPQREESSTQTSDELMTRICELMEQQQVYLDSELKLSDVATRLGTNRNSVSACINSQRGCSFSQFVNEYRINHAKELMLSQPEMKITEVYVSSGFSTESSFFRAFKTATGMTPSEWKAKK